jgi:hypothetical protein
MGWKDALAYAEGSAFADAWERAEAQVAWKEAYDEGEVCGMKSNTTDAENPYPEGSNPYCGWSFGFWGSRNASLLKRAEVRVEALGRVAFEAQGYLDVVNKAKPNHADVVVSVGFVRRVAALAAARGA